MTALTHKALVEHCQSVRTLIKYCCKPPLTINCTCNMKQKYVAGHINSAAVTCEVQPLMYDVKDHKP